MLILPGTTEKTNGHNQFGLGAFQKLASAVVRRIGGYVIFALPKNGM
jgi:hypothetical protein